MAGGRLITVEGIDGAGKSTLVAGLAAALDARGRPVEVLREPGGVALSERIRTLATDPALAVGARAEALLFAAARAQLVDERLRPRLAAGAWVLLDRFVDSSLAYQGAGRGLGVAAVAAVNAFATGGVVADRTLLLALDPALRAARLGARGDAADRLEREDGAFWTAIAAGYADLAEAEPRRIRTLDASAPPSDVLAEALAALADLLDAPDLPDLPDAPDPPDLPDLPDPPDA